MFHIELRQFPHNFCRFNLSDGELAALLAPWRGGQAIELGERKWSPQQAKIRILEGPELDVQELAMGRGWRTAERRSRDVTDRALAAYGTPAPVPGPPPGTGPPPPAPLPGAPTGGSPTGGQALADPLAALVQIGALLGPEAPQLLAAWRAAAAADPSLSPARALEAAEENLRGASKSLQPEPPAG